MNEKFNKKYDKNGILASKGTTSTPLCKNFLRNEFFLKNSVINKSSKL